MQIPTYIIDVILNPMSKRRRRAQKSFYNVPVVDAGARGKSVAKTDEGEVIFLTDAVPGDVVDIETFKKKKSFYEGKVTNFIKRSDRRVEPVCKHFNVCGGCKWQHMGYDSQLYFKQKEVAENLESIGHLELTRNYSYRWFKRTISLP